MRVNMALNTMGCVAFRECLAFRERFQQDMVKHGLKQIRDVWALRELLKQMLKHG